VISVIVTWGAFIAMMGASGIKPGSLAFNAALAGTIAATATATIMFAIGFIPVVGQIIVAIVAAIDAVIFALCGAFGWGEGKVGQYFCKGISGWVSEGIKWMIYGATVMVDMEDDNRLQLSQFDQIFADERKGTSVGNELDYSVHVTNTLRLSSIPIDWKAAAYFYQYNDGVVKSSTFDYQWMETDETDIHDDLSRKDMTGAWSPADEDHTFYIAQDMVTDQSTPLDEAGINRPISLYLAEGFAIPTQECWAVPIPPAWGVPPIPFVTLEPVCYIRTEKDTTHLDLGQSLKYDVFPATLDEFYALTPKNGGYTLGWGQDGDSKFPRQKDADGDGLLNRAAGGSDPDDSAWDFDGDGLSDYYEAQHGTDNAQSDADADGLNDQEELLYGSDPGRADSDGDGLTDVEEIRGWEYVYGFDADGDPRVTWVTSDPSVPDTDADGLTDLREKAFGLHPRVISDPNVLHFESEVHEADAPLLLTRFEEGEGTTAFADESGVQVGACEAANDTCPVSDIAGRYGAGLQFDGQDDVVSLNQMSLNAELPALTIAAWVKGDQGTILRRGSPGEPGYVELTADWFAVGDELVVYSGAVSDTWVHLVATYGDGGMAVYLNGYQAAARDVTARAIAALGTGAEVAIGQPSPVADLTCADLTFISLFALSVKDEPFGLDTTGEFIIKLNDERVTDAPISVKEGEQEPVNVTGLLCGVGTVSMLEDDLLSADDDLGETTVSATATGAGSHIFSDASGDTRARLAWQVSPSFPVAYRYFDGALDELAVFDHVLTSDEIARLQTGLYDPDDLIVVPGARLDYQAQVENKLFARYAQGLLDTEFPITATGTIDPQPFVLQPLEEQTIAGSVTVDADASSTRLELTQVAGALITDWREQSGFAELWLKLDEPAGAATFSDSSGSQPPRSGSCSQGTCPTAERAGTFGYAVEFDGVDEYLTLPKADRLGFQDSSFTVSAWFKGDDFSGGDTALMGTDQTATNRGLFLGFSGGKPHMGFYNNGMNSGFSVATGQWYHVVYRYDATREQMAIYVNGELRNSETGHAAFQGAGAVRLGRAHGSKYFDGLIDDVRVFKRALTQEEIVTLYTLPVLKLGFEEPASSGGVTDASSFGNFGVCVPNMSCPLRTSGMSGQAALFDGSDYIGLASNSSLNMSGGNFTMAAWVYPINSGDSSYDSYAQGLWGRYRSTDATSSPSSDATGAYPTLLRVGRRLRFGFGTGSSWVYKTTSSNVLTVDRWNHVVVTYRTAKDPGTGDETSELVMYVDGQRVQGWELDGVRPTNARELYVGRATDRGQVTIESLYVEAEHDPGSKCEPYITWDGTTILGPYSLGSDETETINHTRQFDGVGVLKVWESDSSSKDDYCGDYIYSTNDPGGSIDIDLSNGFDGELRTEYDNPAVPFRGQLDELTFYKRALSADEVTELYTAGTSGLYLRFDDAPGSTGFQNDAGRNNGICAGDRCPTAGVAGRINQAALLDSAERDYVEVEMDASEDNYGASLWFKTTCTNCGIFSADRGRRGSQGNDRHIYLDSGNLCAQVDSDSNPICSTGANYADGQWHHVVHTFGGSVGGQRLYVDNALAASGARSSSTFSNQDGLNIGLANYAASDYLDGRVDEVQVFHKAISAGRVGDLFDAAPKLTLHLDESLPACAWRAEYYNNTTLGGDPVLTRCEDWGDYFLWTWDSPAEGVNADDFSARWSGDFVFQTGEYTFLAATGATDNYMRVWLDDDLIVDQWSSYGGDQVARQMSSGVHHLEVEYRHGSNHASALLTWDLFRDDAGSAVTDPGALHPTPGQKGQVSLAAEFDGVTDYIAVPSVSDLRLTRFTISAWVMPTTIMDRPQALIFKSDSDGGQRNYGLTIEPDGMQVGLSFQNDLDALVSVQSTASLVMNQWNHVVGTYDGSDLKIYVNGYLQNSDSTSADPVRNNQPLRIGGNVFLSGEYAAFAGRLDEVTIYNHALSAAEVRDTFLYQAKWVEERETQAVTVDAEPPTSCLRSYTEDFPYRSFQDVVMHVEARDPTSRVTLVELGAQREGDPEMTWLAASPCTDAAGDAAWCPVFDPTQLSGPGRYTLQTRAVDQVGHQETPTRTYTLYVDAAPPTVEASFSENELVTAQPHPTVPNAWLLSLSGTVADPPIDGYLGSGVVADSLRVTLFDAGGAVAGTGPQVATIVDGTWTVDYVFLDADPSGAYTISAEAGDQVGNQFTGDLVTVHADTAPPVANLDLASTDVSLDETTTLSGDVTEQPVPLAVTWTTDAGGGEVGLDIACNSQTLYTADAGAFADETTYTWDGATQHGAACQVALTDSAADGGVTGTVQVCGATVASWDGSYGGSQTVPFTADAPDCEVLSIIAGVDSVEAAFVPTLPGSPFTNEPPPSDQMMHLTFDAPYDSGSALYFHDIAGDGSNDFSATGHTGRCAEPRCPAAYEPGRFGSAIRFDGAGDYVDLGKSGINQLTNDFSVMMWINPDRISRFTIQWLIGTWTTQSNDGFKFGIAGEGLRFITHGHCAYDTSGVILEAGAWTHVAAVMGADNRVTFYVNGAPADGGTCGSPATPDAQDSLLLGLVDGRSYAGLMDEVQVFDRALDYGEIQTLFHGAGPALALPFDEAWAADGTALADESGWDHSATLYTGAATNQAVSGQVGAHGLAFDGVDDYVSVVPHTSLDLTGDQFTQAAWVYPSPEGDHTYPVLSGGAYQTALHWRYPFIEVVSRTRLTAGYGDGDYVHTLTTGSVLTEDAWNHVAATYDGATYRVYVNGVEQASTPLDAPPYSDPLFDVGRGTPESGTPACASINFQRIVPESGWSRRFRVLWNGETVFATGDYPQPGIPIPIGQTLDFCGSGQLSVERLVQVGAGSFVWAPLGTQTVDVTPGRDQHTFSAGGVSATVRWKTTYDWTALAYFRGRLDDVRIYPRALSPLEVQELAQTGWQTATLAESGADVYVTDWTASVPQGLEGAYRLDLRGTDLAGNDRVIASAWRGNVDTLAPRVTLTRTTVGDVYRYTTVAEDFDLTETGFRSPCGVGAVSERQAFQSSWYRTLSGQRPQGQERLYRLTATCDVPVFAWRPEIGACQTPMAAHAVAISGTYAFVATDDGLQVVDISDPTAPAPVALYEMYNDALGVALSGGYAFVPDNGVQLHVVDVSDPLNPHAVGEYWSQGLSGGVAVSGTLVYVTGFLWGVEIVDVSLPTTPTARSSYYPQFGGSPLAVDVAGPYAYVTSVAGVTDTLEVVDVSDPDSPQFMGAYSLPAVGQDVAVSGTLACVAAGEAGLRIIDVSNPITPTEVGAFDLPGWYAESVAISGTLATVAAGREGVWGIDVSDPAHPYEVFASYATGGGLGWWEDYYQDAAASGPYAIAAKNSGLLSVVDPRQLLKQATACDTAGHCTTVVEATAAAVLAPTQSGAPLGVTILSVPTVLNDISIIDVTGDAYAVTSTLRALTVTVDSSLLYTDTWAVDTVTETAWSTSWSPAAQGVHILQADLLDWDGNTADDVISVALDTISPTVALSSTLLTSADLRPPNALDLTGLVSDTGSLPAVHVTVSGGGTTQTVTYEASVTGDRLNPPAPGDWSATWYLGSGAAPDGEVYTVTAQATDVAGHTARVTETVAVDIASPGPVTLTLRSDGETLNAGDVVRDISPTLTLTWTAASDGSGVGGYEVMWTVRTSDTVTTSVTAHAPTSRTAQLAVHGEGQEVSVQVGSADVHGQQSWQAVGPVFADSPLTPDYILISDGGRDIQRAWVDSGCSLLGVDRRPDQTQRFHATWDEAALRLAWSGADWSAPSADSGQADSDLFIYLDTVPGGVITAFNPYTGTAPTTLYLPGATPVTPTLAMGADYLVWVRDAETAFLLSWAEISRTWTFETGLTPEVGQFHFAAHINAGQTDLYLPFSLIGITDPVSATLGLVAFAGEHGGEDGLRLWATMPPANPVNSARVVGTAAYAEDEQTFGLLHAYRWDSLGTGVCPNGSLSPVAPQQTDADLQVSLSAAPDGVGYGFLSSGLFWLWDPLFAERPADFGAALPFLDAHAPPLGDGQTVSYTVRYHNQGTVTATAVLADVTAEYALRLPDGDLPDRTHQVVSLGDVGPGVEGSAVFTGVVDLAAARTEAYTPCLATNPEPVCAAYLRLASVDVAIYDDAHGPSGLPRERLWVDHAVDHTPPVFFGIQQPAYLVSPISTTLRGYAYDGATVPTLTLAIYSPPYGTLVLPTMQSCPDDSPADGRWACVLDLVALNGDTPPSDGDIFGIGMQTSDGFGLSSGWSIWRPLVVDAVPPTVTLNLTATHITTGSSLLQGDDYTLFGGITDNRGVGSVEVCVDEVCAAADTQPTDVEAVHTVQIYDDEPAAPVAVGSGTPCGGGEVVRPISVTDSFTVGLVSVGFNAEHVHRDDLWVELESPHGTRVQLLADDGLNSTDHSHYDVLLSDAATAPYNASTDDDPAAPYYDRSARPSQPLQAFIGEGSAGTWTVRMCDARPSADDGFYFRSRLVLTPRDTAPRTGQWAYTVPGIGQADYVVRQVAIYGTDLVGNRTTEPLSLTVIVDSVAPVITVTQVLTTTPLTATAMTVLAGLASDGGGLSDLFIQIQAPDGTMSIERWGETVVHTVYLPLVARSFVSMGSGQLKTEAPIRPKDGALSQTVEFPMAERRVWSYVLRPVQVGRYRLWVTAVDEAGNVTTAGAFEVQVPEELSSIHLPLVLKDYG
jgi:hypothetical protein